MDTAPLPNPEGRSSRIEYSKRLLSSVFPEKEIGPESLALLNDTIYDPRSYEDLKIPVEIKEVYDTKGILIPQHLPENHVVSDGMIPFLENAGYGPVLPIDVVNTAGLNAVAGRKGGDYMFRLLEQQLLSYAGDDPTQTVLIRPAGDEYVFYTRLEESEWSHFRLDALQKAVDLECLYADIPQELETRRHRQEVNKGHISLKSDPMMVDEIEEREQGDERIRLDERWIEALHDSDLQKLVNHITFDPNFEGKVYRSIHHADEDAIFHGEGSQFPLFFEVSTSGLKMINDTAANGKAEGTAFIRKVYSAVDAFRDHLEKKKIPHQIVRMGATSFMFRFPQENISSVASGYTSFSAYVPFEWQYVDMDGEAKRIAITVAARTNVLNYTGVEKVVADPPENMAYAEGLYWWNQLLDTSQAHIPENRDRHELLLSTLKMQNSHEKRGQARRLALMMSFNYLYAAYRRDRQKQQILLGLYQEVLGEQFDESDFMYKGDGIPDGYIV